ncbi:cellulose binding domain-containing protein [Micromonospora echinofusca]|uniref:CBM2 domain-containing protein n=1 Tax=Micromonospora echinofusca TaxID=47858 RepID=A0ABS3W016_MICEH|nr:cellulose binding domain-containing protein [Micromonospora echinofusca]MBO4210119.1 hypothetical protein [Micromonospora echinofusca]
MAHIPRLSRRNLVVAGAIGALTMGTSVALPAADATAATGCAVTYTTSSWTGEFTAAITIKNLGDPVNGWTLGFTFPDSGQKVGQGWSATYSQTGSSVTAKDLGYNASLTTGASTSIGFNGTWTTSNPAPTSFTLNGTVCTGSTTPTTAPPPTTATTTPRSTPSPTTGGPTCCGSACTSRRTATRPTRPCSPTG